eukprot:symbB.v1.2.034892.t1/scaffold4583.1/size37721/1
MVKILHTAQTELALAIEGKHSKHREVSGGMLFLTIFIQDIAVSREHKIGTEISVGTMGHVPSERIQAWFSLATTLDSADWEVAVAQPEATLSHRSCPCCWGGHLVKFDYASILVEGTGHLRPSDLLLRPEVRGLFGQSLDRCHAQLGMETVSVFAPGDAVMAQQTNIPILRMCRLLFGESKTSFCTFFYNEKPVLARHQLRRDFPEPGDCTLAWFQEIEGTWQEYLIVCRSNGIHGDDRSYRIERENGG